MAHKKILCRGILGEKAAVAPEELTFRPSVYGVIIKRGKILLCHEVDGYDFPGGGVDLGETLEDALHREVWEETGLKVRIGPVIAAASGFFITPAKKTCVESILLHFICTNPTGTISTKNLTGSYEKKYSGGAEWIDLRNLKKIKFINTSIDARAIIKKALV